MIANLTNKIGKTALGTNEMPRAKAGGNAGARKEGQQTCCGVLLINHQCIQPKVNRTEQIRFRHKTHLMNMRSALTYRMNAMPFMAYMLHTAPHFPLHIHRKNAY